jgi:hypothetical protein
MSSATTTAARVARYELEVAIEAPRDVVWKGLS